MYTYIIKNHTMYNIIFPRKWSKLSCMCRYSSRIDGQKLPQSSTSSDGISPPPRIPRGPTDILQALAATVGPDPTAAHYKYHDDPYLIPLSNYRKRAYSLSAEAGRKAAAWIRDEHAELFTTREWDPPGKAKTPYFNADPIIEAFAPKPIYNDLSKVTEEDLKYTIKNALLEDAVKVYQLLGGRGGISDHLQMELLQLLCFYNEREPESVEWQEERWFSSNTRERQMVTWKLGGLADKIFTSLEPKTSEAYCVIIQGMAKYFQAERAYVLTQEAREKGITLSTEVYNNLLACVGFLREGSTLRIEMLKNLLIEMNDQGLSPNSGTLTSCLRSVSAWGGGKQLQEFATDLLAEFKQLDIQPGLADYYYLLCLFCKERGPRIDIMSTIINELENKEKLTAVDVMDTNFFITAMGVCSDHLQNVDLADRLHALLMENDNYTLVGDAYKESIYYRHYVKVTCRHAPFEKATQLLDLLIPNIYIPEPSIMEEIIRTLELGGAGDRLAQAASQLIIFGLAKRIKLVDALVNAMCNCYHSQDEEVKEKMRSAAADLLNYGQEEEELQQANDNRTPIQNLSAAGVCGIMEMCADAEDKESEAWASVAAGAARLRRGEVAGVPARPDALVTIAERAASLGLHDLSASIVSYLAECGFEEAEAAGVSSLATILNRPADDVRTLLAQPRAQIAASLHPAALAVVDAYYLAKSGTASSAIEDTTSSSSDSESSDDE